MASNLRVDTILPSTGTTLGIGTASGTINFLGNSNIDTSGTLTAASASITGNLGVGGTLTYEDVTNIDSVGVITARSGIDAASNLLLKTGGTEKLKIDSSGRVHIGGVTGPNSAKLFVSGTNSNSYVTLRNTSASDGSGARWNSIRFQGTQSGGEVSDLVHLQANHDGTSDDEKGSFQILVNDGNDGDSLQERLRITSSGALGTNAIVRSANGGLDLCAQGATNLGTLTLGAGGGQNGQSRNNNQENQFRIMMPTYADPSLMKTVLYGVSGNSAHELHYGGGTGWAYATNKHMFYTAENQTTGAGTEAVRINQYGFVKMKGDMASHMSADGNNYHEMQADNPHVQILNMKHGSSNGYGIMAQFNHGKSTHWAYRVYNYASGSDNCFIRTDGDLENINNSYGSTSDVKLKENIVDAKSQWNDIKALKVRNFNYKADENKTKLLGLVAQEAETVCPSLVKEQPDLDVDNKDLGTTTKYLKYSILYMKAIKALQEAQTRIETLESKVAALEGS